MSYVLNQYNQPRVAATDVNSSTNQSYMTVLTGGTPSRRQNASDTGVTGVSLDPFVDECLQLGYSLTPGTNYYFHAKIKRLSSDQIFYLYLVNYDDAGTEARSQYLKTITIQAGLETEWVDFEIIFSPLIAFDCILFQLQRTISDYRDNTRYPVIIYEELSHINNIIASKIKSGVGLLKMGIQSHPGLMMCLNGEEIHIGRSGTYEVRNGIILIEFFSVIIAATENYDGNNPLRDPVTGARLTIDEYLEYIASLPIVASQTTTNSQCIFDNSKLRAMDSFSMDYMYEED